MDTSPSAPAPGHWETLAQAFAAYQYPGENLSLVQRIVDSVGVIRFDGRSNYIKAIRADGERHLTIHFGYTSGFATEDDAISAAGDVDREMHGSRWRVNHPVNDVGDHHRGDALGMNGRREVEQCLSCFSELPLSGECGICA